MELLAHLFIHSKTTEVMKKLLITFLVLFVGIATKATAQSFNIIVNEANTTESVSQDELADIFMKEKESWNDGSSITPIDQKANSDIRRIFSAQVLGESVGAIRSHWQQAAFSGSASAPIELSSDQQVINFVNANAGAVGYISSTTDAAGVKVLSIN